MFFFCELLLPTLHKLYGLLACSYTFFHSQDRFLLLRFVQNVARLASVVWASRVLKPNKSVKGTRRPLAQLTSVFIKVLWLRLASVSGAPLTVTLGSLKRVPYITDVTRRRVGERIISR